MRLTRILRGSLCIGLLTGLMALGTGCPATGGGGGGGGGGDNVNDNTGGNTNDNSGGNTNDNAGGNTNDNTNDNGSSLLPAIVKTQIIVGNGGKIAVGDDLLVYGVGSDEDETSAFARYNQPAGVHFLIPSEADLNTTGGTMITGSDVLFGHRDFAVAGKKVALVRSTNAVSVYDTVTGELVDISPADITLHPLSVTQDSPGHMVADGHYIATINNTGFYGGTAVSDGNAIKVIDVSGAVPNVISFPMPASFGENDTFDQVAIDADAMQVAALGANDLFIYDIADPTAAPTQFDFGFGTDNGLIGQDVQIRLDGGYVIFHEDSDFDPVVSLFDITSGSVTPFIDNPTQDGARVAIDGGRFAYFLLRENADQEEGGGSTNVRSAIGTVATAPAATLASQLDHYGFRPSVVDLSSSAGPVFTQDDCLHSKLIGYGSRVCITPDGAYTFLADWSSPDSNFGYVHMSTGGAFTDLADPELTTVTGSLMGSDIVCSAETVAFRGLRQAGDSGCITTVDWVIGFIRVDELDN